MKLSSLPASLSPFGILRRFRRHPLATLEALRNEHGDVAPFRFFHKPGFLLSDPALVQEVLVTQNANFTKSLGLQRAKLLLGEGLLTSEEPLHMRQRRLVQPAFHRDRLHGYGQTMVALASEWMARWDREWKPGAVVDLHSETVQLTLSIVSKALYHADVRRDAASISEVGTAVMSMFRLLVLPFASTFLKLPIGPSRRFHAARRKLDELVYGMIAERRKSGEDTGDLLSMLLVAQDAEDPAPGAGRMTDKQVRDEILTLFLAGHETTANALSWTWYLLATHPECEQAMFEELDRVLGGRPPEAGDVESLRYTYAVFAESMRLFPPAWLIGRMSRDAFSMGGRRFPGDAIFFAAPWTMHRDPRFWPEPAEFAPERWLAPNPDRPKFAYFPFGGGPRVCIGERFAWMEGVLLLARIGQRWRFRLAPQARIVPQPLITLRLKYGLPVTAEPRA